MSNAFRMGLLKRKDTWPQPIMETIVHIPTQFREDMVPGLFERLVQAYPEGKNGPNSFRVFLPQDDPRTQAVTRMLYDAGRTRWPGAPVVFDKTKHFLFDLIRQYSESDYRVADFLWIHPKNHIEGGYRPEEDAFVLSSRDLRKKWSFAHDDDGGVLVPNRVKELLERSGLLGVQFRATVVDDESDGPAERVAWGGKYGDPWWGLASDITLPPYAPSMKVEDRHGKPVPRGTAGYALIWEPPFRGVELHYLESEIAAVRFDVAQSLEWTGPAPFARNLVVSKRFYEFCQTNRLPCEFVPVRLDPG